MKHNIRINGEVKEIDCELGSGIFDKNGHEIFEGDIVGWGNYKSQVVFNDGGFVVATWEGERELSSCIEYTIVGHVNAPSFKDTGRAWSPQMHDAYNRLLDAFIARKSPETLCEAALAVVKAAKADKRFDED